MFFILANSHDGGESWVDDFSETFTTGKEAQERVVYYRDYYSSWRPEFRSRVRKVVDTDSDNFIARELAKGHNFIDWSKLPAGVTIPPYHLAHFHPTEKGKVRFFRDTENAVEERYTVCSLTRFFATHMELAVEDFEDYLIEIGHYSGKSQFKILTTEEDIVAAYENGPTSCMNDPEDYPLVDPHPASVYASPDFAVAVMQRDGEADITARAVISPVKKIYFRIYGHSKLLEAHLKEQGYRRTGAWSAWRGLRLKAIEYNGGWDEEYICPYLDMSETVSLSRCKQYLKIAGPHGRFSSRNCDGTAN